MLYKNTVSRIKNLPWSTLSEEQLLSLMVLSYFAATEFAESLRIALRHLPQNESLRTMARGELKTDNLLFGSYKKKGDHAGFLLHFVEEYDLRSLTSAVLPAMFRTGQAYRNLIGQLPDEIRVMSVCSREVELPEIFQEILKAPSWTHPALQAFHYYLTRHIELDTAPGGHGELLSDFPIHDRVNQFYQIRLLLYAPLFGAELCS